MATAGNKVDWDWAPTHRYHAAGSSPSLKWQALAPFAQAGALIAAGLLVLRRSAGR